MSIKTNILNQYASDLNKISIANGYSIDLTKFIYVQNFDWLLITKPKELPAIYVDQDPMTVGKDTEMVVRLNCVYNFSNNDDIYISNLITNVNQNVRWMIELNSPTIAKDKCSELVKLDGFVRIEESIYPTSLIEIYNNYSLYQIKYRITIDENYIAATEAISNLQNKYFETVTTPIFNDTTVADANTKINKQEVVVQTITADPVNSWTFGTDCSASGLGSFAQGLSVSAIGNYSHAEGTSLFSPPYFYPLLAVGDYSHAEGYANISNGNYSHAEGSLSLTLGECSHAEGYMTSATGACSHSEGAWSQANGAYSHAEGSSNFASGSWSHAEGNFTAANNFASHSEGGGTKANNSYSHAEGWGSIANGLASHSEGYGTAANGHGSHAEGGDYYNTYIGTTANGLASHSEGYGTIAQIDYSHASGMYNATGSDLCFMIGNGESLTSRSNAFSVAWSGNATLSGTLTAGGYAVGTTAGITQDIAITDQGGTTHNLSFVKGILTSYTTS